MTGIETLTTLADDVQVGDHIHYGGSSGHHDDIKGIVQWVEVTEHGEIMLKVSSTRYGSVGIKRTIYLAPSTALVRYIQF